MMRWVRMRNEKVYEMAGKAAGVTCIVKRNSLRLCGHIRRIPEERIHI